MSIKTLTERLEAAREAADAAKKAADAIELELRNALAASIEAAYATKEDKFGTANVEADGVSFKVFTPKVVVWDQSKLRDIYDTIKRSNDNPDDYIKVSYEVSEAKYKAWPQLIRESFEDARTTKEGKVKIEVIK